jgi:hypothetical protein
MKITTLTSALISAMFSIGAAQATTILVDDFNAPVSFISIIDTTANGSAVTATSSTAAGSLAASRDISVDLTQKNTRTAAITADVGGGTTDGYLNFSVSTGDNGIGKVIWALPAFTLPSGDSLFSFSILASALGSTANTPALNNIAFAFTGNTAGNNFSLNTSVPAYTFANPGAALTLALTGAQSAFLSGGGQLALTFSGGQGWNLALDQFSINSDSPASVPVPASAALFGIALVAMRLVGKKSVANKS